MLKACSQRLSHLPFLRLYPYVLPEAHSIWGGHVLLVLSLLKTQAGVRRALNIERGKATADVSASIWDTSACRQRDVLHLHRMQAMRPHLRPASEGVRPTPVRGEKKTDEEAMEAVRLGAEGVSSTSGACTDVVMRTGASGFCTSPSMPSTCSVVSSSCTGVQHSLDGLHAERGAL